MLLSSEILTTFDLCERRGVWMSQYERLRVPPLRAVYQGLDAGLRSSSPDAAGETVMRIARDEGLDVHGQVPVYDIATHYAGLATILATWMRGKGVAWKRIEECDLLHRSAHRWQSACYEAGKKMRRIALVDYWSDERRDAELRSWRTLGEVAVLGRPLLVNVISIGHVVTSRRASHWTRCWAHPMLGGVFRFRRKGAPRKGEGFTGNWDRVWRENSELTTEHWLNQMKNDTCFEELVHSLEVAFDPLHGEFLRHDLQRMAGSLERHLYNQEIPPMRRSGCYGFSPCPFLAACHAVPRPIQPGSLGFTLRPKRSPKPVEDGSELVQVGQSGSTQV